MRTVSYQPIKPVTAAWNLEYAEAIAVLFVQFDGNEVNVIGSAVWPFQSIHGALEELTAYPWRKRIETHVLPPDHHGTYSKIFLEAELEVDLAPEVPDSETVYLTRELFPLLNIDQAEGRPWCKDGEENNAELIDSINGYRAREAAEPETFLPQATHSWHVYLVRALELLAIWRDQGGGLELRRPDYSLRNRAVI